ncbi:hypothetical protein GCM10027435_08760 [Haloparvum alkalitolerans]|uniref:DUF7331 family protein n=1 Tax=Haloparvum alkalitolerans TaxID=1042953 RepID=UPI003CF8BE8A
MGTGPLAATERHLPCDTIPRGVTSNSHADDGTVERADDRAAAGDAEAVVEAYEDDGSVVLFEAENPLAWVEATRTVALRDAA